MKVKKAEIPFRRYKLVEFIAFKLITNNEFIKKITNDSDKLNNVF